MFKRKESGSSQDLEHELAHVKSIKLHHSPKEASDEDQDETAGSSKRATPPASCSSQPPFAKNAAALSFIYGNYPSYYGYRLGGKGKTDPRLEILKRLKDQAALDLSGKKILDIGCNAGDVTIEIGRQLEPEMILGIDIDPSLIKKARHHLQFQYSLMKPGQINRLELKPNASAGPDEHVPKEIDAIAALSEHCSATYFPKSFPIVFGSIPMVDSMSAQSKASEALSDHSRNTPFPFNVYFKCKNWIDEKEAMVPHSMDAILCLSVTKWIHLNWGDAGIMRLFARAYEELKPGGVLILESQPFSSYAKKRHVSHVPHDQIALKPESFIPYLLNTVGFQSHQKIEPGSLDPHFSAVQGKSARFPLVKNK